MHKHGRRAILFPFNISSKHITHSSLSSLRISSRILKFNIKLVGLSILIILWIDTIIVKRRFCNAHDQMAFNIVRQNCFRTKRTFKSYLKIYIFRFINMHVEITHMFIYIYHNWVSFSHLVIFKTILMIMIIIIRNKIITVKWEKMNRKWMSSKAIWGGQIIIIGWHWKNFSRRGRGHTEWW